MKKKIIFFSTCVLIIICAYVLYSIHKTKKAIDLAINNTITLDAQLNSYIWEHTNDLDLALDNQTFALPLNYTLHDSPVSNFAIYKSSGSPKMYLNIHLNSDYLGFLPFFKPKTVPFIQFQYSIVSQQTIYKSCYSNLPKIYLPKNCSLAF